MTGPAVAWWLLRALAAAARLALATLLAALLWAAPRVWRGALTAVDLVEAAGVAGWRRWEVRRCAVVVDEQPTTRALPAPGPTWSALISEESNRWP